MPNCRRNATLRLIIAIIAPAAHKIQELPIRRVQYKAYLPRRTFIAAGGHEIPDYVLKNRR